MVKRWIGLGALGFLVWAPVALASTGTVFQCDVEGEADVQVLMDAEGKTITVEQSGKTSSVTRGRGGRFQIDFAGKTFVFVVSENDHTGTMTITRSRLSRRGKCS